MKVEILGVEYHLPQRAETNDDLVRECPDWDMNRIYKKSGIGTRHISAADETATDLGLQAASKLLQRGVVPVEEIDYLLFCTESPDHFLPPGACVLQRSLGLARDIGAFDFNLGCSGYVYGLQLAKSLIQSRMARNVLLITGDTYSKYIHPLDRTVRTIFGDAATATLIGQAGDGPGELREFVVGTNGEGAKNLVVPAGGLRVPRSAETAKEYTDDAGCVRSQDHLFMNGRAIFGFALEVVPKLVDDLLGKAGVSADDVDWYIYHQANTYMLATLAKLSNLPAEKMVLEMEHVGNTVASSIPIAIQRYVEHGRIRSGHLLMLVGFGVGYSWGACLATWS